jgi:hypothetical protein
MMRLAVAANWSTRLPARVMVMAQPLESPVTEPWVGYAAGNLHFIGPDQLRDEGGVAGAVGRPQNLQGRSSEQLGLGDNRPGHFAVGDNHQRRPSRCGELHRKTTGHYVDNHDLGSSRTGQEDWFHYNARFRYATQTRLADLAAHVVVPRPLHCAVARLGLKADCTEPG